MTLIYWIIGGLCIASALIVLACIRVGNDHEYRDHNPYDGEGW